MRFKVLLIITLLFTSAIVGQLLFGSDIRDYLPYGTVYQYLRGDKIWQNKAPVDVRDFGAKGNGIDDDTVYIQNAINYVFALGGGTVFLPKGTYLLNTTPSAGYYLLIAKSGVSVIGSGPESILKAGDNLRDLNHGLAILYNNTEALSDILYKDFTIDYNGQNNLWLIGYGANAFINRTGGHAGVSNFTVDNVTFLNSAGGHFIFIHTGGSNIKIINSTFKESGTSIFGNQITDHSSVYVEANDVVVQGNNFINSAQDNVGTAIEVHGSNTRVSNNHVAYYRRFANLCANVQDASGTEFHHNTAIHMLSGIALWSVPPYLGSHWNINNNIIGIAENAGETSPTGILSDITRNTSTVNLSNISIVGNEIYQETFINDTYGIRGMDLTRIDDLLIANNNIHDLWFPAIKLQTQVDRTMNRIQIIGNKIKDVGLTSVVANKRAIGFAACNAIGGEINNIDIKSNVITLGAPSGTVANYGIEFNDKNFPNTRIVNNTILGAASRPINKSATIATDLFYIDGEGPYNPYGYIRASLGSRWVNTSVSPPIIYNAKIVADDGSATVWRIQSDQKVIYTAKGAANVLTTLQASDTLMRFLALGATNLPTANTTGLQFCGIAVTAAVSAIYPNTGDIITVGATPIAAGNAVRNISGAIGDYICLLSSDGAGNWVATSRSGTWAQ